MTHICKIVAECKQIYTLYKHFTHKILIGNYCASKLMCYLAWEVLALSRNEGASPYCNEFRHSLHSGRIC